MNDELLALDETGLDAAVRECARITRPEISDDEFEQIKADNSPRYQNTRTEMGRAIRAYLRAAKPALSSIVTCCVTGAIPGDGGACGDCDPCLFSEASLPSPVKRLIAEKNSLLHRIGELEDELGSLRSLASSDGGVKVRELEWSPHPAGGEQALAAGLGLYRVHRDGSNWYLVPDHMGEGGKAAAQADYEARIRSALETGWHLAPAHATSGDGVIEAAVAEIEERFAAILARGEASSQRTILSSDCVDPDIEAAIRADEREKCARLALDEKVGSCTGDGADEAYNRACDHIAAAIRAGRGEA